MGARLDGSQVYVAGHTGMVGSAVWRALERRGSSPFGWPSAEVDLTDRDAAFDAITSTQPEIIVLAAARVGGILANSSFPVEFLVDNLRIQANVMEAAHAADVDRLLFLGSSCIYPRLAPQPIREESLLTGPLEATNEAYAIAKIAGLMSVQAYRRQYGRHWISVMPANLYGPGDNFDLDSAHVLAALLRRFHEANAASAPHVTVWGSGTPRREFLHVDDLADACLLLLEAYDDDLAINVGTGQDVSIAELSALIADVVGYRGSVQWDDSKPDGTPRKLLDVARIHELGWQAQIDLEPGLRTSYDWYLTHATA